MSTKASTNTPDCGFEDMVSPHLDALLRTAERLTGSAADAEDLVQDCLLKAFRFFASYQADTNFKAWIFKILTNTFLNHWRQRRRGQLSLDHEEAPDIPAEEQETTIEKLAPTFARRESAVLELIDSRISQALNELPEQLRIVFMLSTLEDLKYREISDILDIPVGTVMSRLFRSRAMLQERLENYARESGYLKP